MATIATALGEAAPFAHCSCCSQMASLVAALAMNSPERHRTAGVLLHAATSVFQVPANAARFVPGPRRSSWLALAYLSTSPRICGIAYLTV